ncbi:hypothetical protein [Halovenus halobia]|uniref:hypothetical protein n=1 Tax=Halovenus halobia TaxID=3396622 RepID=UPI003F566E29
MAFVLDPIETMMDKLDPKIIAAVSFPALLIVSLPFVYISGIFSIILTNQFLNPSIHPDSSIGYTVGPAVGILFALWASNGMYRLAKEVQDESGTEMPTA